MSTRTPANLQDNYTGPPQPTGPPAGNKEAGREVLDDGQEEVFSRRAVELGMIEDPTGLGPEDVAAVPMSPVRSGS